MMHNAAHVSSRRMQLITFCISLFVSAWNTASAQTQIELNDQSSLVLREAETVMTSSLASIRQLYASDPQFLHCLGESQRAWEVYRDRQLAMVFAKKDDHKEGYGTVFPMCWAIWKARLTNQRITELKLWLDGIEEGEVCRGSIRVK